MKHNHNPDNVTLQQLYRQRKAQQPAPERLKQKLLKQPATQKNSNQWRYLLPAITASIATVVLIWPKQTLMESKELISPANQMLSETVDADAPPTTEQLRAVPQPTQAMQAAPIAKSLPPQPKPASAAKMAKPESTMSLADHSYAEGQSPMEQAPTHNDAAMASMPAALTLSDADDTALEFVQDEPEKLNATSNSLEALVSKPLLLHVVDGNAGRFRDCLGRDVDLPVTTDLLGWLQAELNTEGQWILTTMPSSRCPE